MKHDSSDLGSSDAAATIRDIIDALSSDDTWPRVEALLRQAVGVVADEWQKVSAAGPGVKIDIKSLVRDLGSGELNSHLQHFFSMNHRFIANLAEKNHRAAVETYDFVDAHMPGAIFALNQMSVIASKREEISRLGGHILDLGVYKGGSTRALAGIFPKETIHGFDSFEGLPDDWSHSLKGSFDIKGILPNVPANVRLYKGWFDDTLPVWFAKNKNRPISLLRIDCDIYSSTRTIFRELRPLIRSGTWIMFDELIGYRGWKDHEYKAFTEYQAESGIEFEYAAFGLTYAMGFVK